MQCLGRLCGTRTRRCHLAEFFDAEDGGDGDGDKLRDFDDPPDSLPDGRLSR